VFGFTGEETDSDGLIDLRARYYNPSIGQFMRLDPIETLNRYQYSGGNPVNFIDPSGLICEKPERWNKCSGSMNDPCS